MANNEHGVKGESTAPLGSLFEFDVVCEQPTLGPSKLGKIGSALVALGTDSDGKEYVITGGLKSNDVNLDY